jgi:hypothetical protein
MDITGSLTFILTLRAGSLLERRRLNYAATGEGKMPLVGKRLTVTDQHALIDGGVYLLGPRSAYEPAQIEA